MNCGLSWKACSTHSAPSEGTGASADVVAVGHVAIIHVSSTEIEKLVKKDPEFGVRIYRFLAITGSNRLRAANKVVHELI